MRAVNEFRVDLSRVLALHVADWPGTSPTIVLVHPNRTINRVWNHVVAASRLPHRFLAPGLRGHGASDYPSQGSHLTDHRDDLIDFIESLGAGPVFLVGQAIGAMLALMIARWRPDLVRDHSMAIRTDRPVLVFGGAEATVLPSTIVDRVCALLANHRRAVLPAADHRLSQDNPAGFAALMDCFVLAQGRTWFSESGTAG